MLKGFNNEISKERCKHGLIKSWCGLCQDYRPIVKRKKIIGAKKEERMKVESSKQPKKYPGILDQSYKLCGVGQCAANGNHERCPQPVYGENEMFCYYHHKIEDQKVGVVRII